jgi:hypothetical protein
MAIKSELQHEPDRRVVIDHENLEASGHAQQAQTQTEKRSRAGTNVSPMCTTPSWWTARQDALGVTVVIMSNLLTGTQEIREAFESHKAKGTKGIFDALLEDRAC